jgi:hypothetical protein
LLKIISHVRNTLHNIRKLVGIVKQKGSGGR